MNSKNIIPWILAFVFLAALCFLFASGKSKEKELAQLRQENAELPQLRAAAEKANTQSSNSDATVAEKERQELIRLRNEVGVLRREKQQLATQAQQAEQKSEKLLQTQQAQQSQLQQQNQQLAQQSQQGQTDKARNTCINNLRQIDGAIQQWALENKQPADALVVAKQIEPYLPGTKLPVCPSGGVYTIATVSAAPTCSIPGHALPQ